MTGLWAFETHLPYQKYQGPPIEKKYSSYRITYWHLFVWNLKRLGFRWLCLNFSSLNLIHHNFIRIIRKQLVLFRYGTDSSRKLCNEFKLGNFSLREKENSTVFPLQSQVFPRVTREKQKGLHKIFKKIRGRL